MAQSFSERMIAENKKFIFSVQPYRKKKSHVIKTKNEAYVGYKLMLRNPSSTYFRKKKSLQSAASILFCSPVGHNTTDSSDKLTCTDFVDFDKSQDRFGQMFWSKKVSKNLDVKSKVFKGGYRKDIRLVQNLRKGETVFNHFN